MDDTSSFAALELMIHQGWFWDQFERLEALLDDLARKNVITAAEHQSLLELAKRLSIDSRKENYPKNNTGSATASAELG